MVSTMLEAAPLDRPAAARRLCCSTRSSAPRLRGSRPRVGRAGASVGAAFAVAGSPSCWRLRALLRQGGGALVDRTFYRGSRPARSRSTSRLRFDPLSAVMMLVVTGVGFLIHVYSIGYMDARRGFARFFAYLNLFMFAMLMLVLGDNLLLMFVGWEGVGLCSYLLIGFWYDEERERRRREEGVHRQPHRRLRLPARHASCCSGRFGATRRLDAAISPSSARTRTPISPAVATAVALLLFVGATGKSAQIPLYVWLPDAMAGPTPVSRADPRRDHGDGRRLHDRAHELPLRRCRRGAARGGGRSARPPRSSPRRSALVAERHQEGARVLDRQPARLHVPRRRRRRLRRRHLPL